jgi:hypothetical protein
MSRLRGHGSITVVAMNAPLFMGRSLTQGQIAQAFPLLALASITLGAEQWRWLAHAILSETEPPPVGIMTLQSPTGYIHGLFRFRASADQEGTVTLFVDDLVAPDLFGHALAGCLTDVLGELAARHGCATIDIGTPPPLHGTNLEVELSRRGFGWRRRSMVKALGAP